MWIVEDWTIKRGWNVVFDSWARLMIESRNLIPGFSHPITTAQTLTRRVNNRCRMQRWRLFTLQVHTLKKLSSFLVYFLVTRPIEHVQWRFSCRLRPRVPARPIDFTLWRCLFSAPGWGTSLGQRQFPSSEPLTDAISLSLLHFSFSLGTCSAALARYW